MDKKDLKKINEKIEKEKNILSESEKEINSFFLSSFKESIDKSRGLSGNIGEWSEIYVFYSILFNGGINLATIDSFGNIQNNSGSFLPVTEIFRTDTNTGFSLKFCTASQQNGINACKIFINENSVPITEYSREELGKILNMLCISLANAKKDTSQNACSLVFSEQTNFLNKIFINNIKSPAQKISNVFGGKTDIAIRTPEQTSIKAFETFSIKSNIGNQSTLINSSRLNEVVYELDGCTDEIMEKINLIPKTGSWLKKRTVSLLSNNNINIVFNNFKGETYNNNLVLISDREPETIAYAVLYSYNTELAGFSNRNISSVAETLIKEDPLCIKHSKDTYYRKRLKDFLYEFAFGMQCSIPWDGQNEITGGYIFVSKQGNVFAVRINNQNTYKDWLFQNTKFDTPSTSRGSNIGEIIKINGKYFYTLGTLVKFITH